MEREPDRQNQPKPAGEDANGTGPHTPTSSNSEPSTPTTPTPPRLTPNPRLLDSAAPTPTPTTSSPPPPLTPAPSVSATCGPKMPGGGAAGGAAAAGGGGGASSPHILVPIPPKLTSTLRTYSRPILPLPKTSPATQTSSSSSSSTTSPLPFNSSPSSCTTHNKTSTASLTNGSTKTAPTTTSTPITPFHTPASPPGRQLQSLTLRPPPPGALTIPPSLRLKTSAGAAAAPPPPLSRPHGPVFPPLRPRPQPSTTVTESPATPSRHLSVPPPTLYSPVRAVPLRPRLHSPNGHRAVSPRQTSTLQPIVASTQASAIRLKSCPLSSTVRAPGNAQHSPLPTVTSHFERSPSAARQLQIIALSSGRQPQPATYTHPAVQPPVVESSETLGQSKRTLGGEDMLPPPLNSSLPKTASLPSLLSPASPQSQASLQTETLTQKGGAKEGEEQKERGRGVRDEGSKDLMVDRDNQRETEEKKVVQKETGSEPAREDNQMEVTEDGQRDQERSEGGKETKMEEEGEMPMDQSENPTSQVQNTDPVSVKDSDMEPKPSNFSSAPVTVQTLLPVPVPVQTPPPVPVHTPVPVSAPVPVPALEAQRDLQPVNQEDFCESMSIQSDNQSALSSLSSQSPPSSPFVTPSSAENPPPLLPAQDAHPTDLSLPHHQDEKVDEVVGGPWPPAAGKTMETNGHSEDESEGFDQSEGGPWEPRAWPGGRQVLTHLVEGFVIQEGLEPFPVNRSSLLVPDQVTKPQEVNGTNGKVAPPATEDAVKRTDPSTDSEEEEGGDMDDAGTRSGHRDRTVLHCQFCGKRGHAHNFMRSKRFCSTSCARGFNVRLTKRLRALSAGSRSERPRPALNRAESVPGKPLLLRLPRDLWSAGRQEKEGKEKVTAEEEDEEDEEEEEEEEEDLAGGGGEEEEEDDEDDRGEGDPAVSVTTRSERRATRRARRRRASAPAVTTSTPTSTFTPAPSQWSVEEVTAFIHTLPGCGDVAEAFRVQEIDGQALLLLTEDHLMTSMNIKLGPALKICAHINALKNQ
ncbi:polyhomeotic-like protein 3 isoform 4-T4 [Pholidichthys leucotaenia]